MSYFRTNRSAWTVCIWKRFSPLIDRLVCTIQINQNSDALIKYVAQYHILYCGQIEIRLSVIAIPISDFLIALVRPSRYYHPSSYRLITSTTDFQFFILSKWCISLEHATTRPKLWPAHLGAFQPSNLQD